MKRFLCLLLLTQGIAASILSNEPLTVGSLAELERATRGLGPAVTVLVSDGTYETAKPMRIEGKRGTTEAPIVLQAEHRGRATIGGAGGFVVRDCEHLVLEGFVFTHDADQQAVQIVNCRHVRVTRNVFRLSERAKPRHWEHWVTVDGARSGQNRVDHNLFERKVNRGSHVFVRGDDTALVCSQHDRIDHNHFRDVVFAKGENGHETIRTGGNDLGASGRSSFTTIEENLLERCSGEDEIMSLKSSDNIVRGNTLLNCRGAICLRLGNRSVVSGNSIIATDGEPGRGGVKLYGFEHRVFNNHFLGLTGRRHEAPLALVPGTLDTPTTGNIGKKYDNMTSAAPTRCWIASNTWIDCAPLQFGFKQEKERPCIPTDCIFVSNVVVRTKPQSLPLVNLEPVRNLRAHDNLGYVCGPPPSGEWSGWFRFEDSRLRRTNNTPKPLTASDVGPDANDAGQKPALWAVYYAWYQTAGGPHGKSSMWTVDDANKTPRSKAQPLIGYYDSDNPDVARWHVRLAKAAGIEAFLVSWWGGANVSGAAFEKTILPVAAEEKFKVAMCCELAQFHHDVKVLARQMAKVLKCVKDSPAYLRVDGKPLVYLYQVPFAPKLTPETFAELTRGVEAEVGPVYWMMDKVTNAQNRGLNFPSEWLKLPDVLMIGFYGTFSIKRIWKYDELAPHYSRLVREAHAAGKKAFLPAHPGHDNSGFRPNDFFVIPRNDGATLRGYLRAIADAGADVALLTSFNEWPETTIIEPSSWPDPYFYLKLLAEWKGVAFNIPPLPPRKQ
jgi:hypothetical protein